MTNHPAIGAFMGVPFFHHDLIFRQDMRHRLFCFHMTGALIDGLAAIGVFSFLAFAFLPEWEQTIEASWDDASMCQHFFDYQVTWMKRMGKLLESRTYIMDWSLLTYYNLRGLLWFCFFLYEIMSN
jgi:hypothetical protein